MDPVSIIVGLGLLAQALFLIYVALLLLGMIIDWFRERMASSRNKVAFTVQEKMRNGQFKTIAGVLNPYTDKVEATKGYKSDDIDSDLYDAHYDSEVVIWE